MNKNKLADDLDLILLKAKDSFEILNNKSIFITGATGFFGKWLLEAFSRINAENGFHIKIFALSRDPERFETSYPHLAKNVHFIKGDIKDFEFDGIECDYIIHAATIASAKLNEEDPSFMFSHIIDGTSRVLELASIKNTKRILHTSSGAVYGKQPTHIDHVNESFSGAPLTNDYRSAYGEGKRVSELLGTLFSKKSGVDFLSARCFAFGGPYLPLEEHFALGNFFKNAMDGKDIIVLGDGTALRSYLYSADLVVWLLRILTHGKNCENYNVGSHKALSIEKLAHEVAHHFPGIKVSIKKSPVPDSPASRYIPDTALIRDELGVSESYSISDIILNMKEFYS